MTSIRHMGALAALLVSGAIPAFGCAASNETAQPPETAITHSAAAEQGDTDVAAAGLVEHDQHHHAGGVTLLIALSIDTLGVSNEQRLQVEQIRKDLHAKMEPARAAEQGVLNALADGIAGGAIDKTKVDAAVAQLNATSSAVDDATVDALNLLHAALTPLQRSVLADKLEAHWEVWEKANSDEKAERGKPTPQHAKVASEIGLTPDQLDKIHANLADPNKPEAAHLATKDADAHVHAFAQAFKADTFDAKALTTRSTVNANVASFGAAHMARFYEAVDPVLTAEQRPKLAQILREHAHYSAARAQGEG